MIPRPVFFNESNKERLATIVKPLTFNLVMSGYRGVDGGRQVSGQHSQPLGPSEEMRRLHYEWECTEYLGGPQNDRW